MSRLYRKGVCQRDHETLAHLGYLQCDWCGVRFVQGSQEALIASAKTSIYRHLCTLCVYKTQGDNNGAVHARKELIHATMELAVASQRPWIDTFPKALETFPTKTDQLIEVFLKQPQQQYPAK